MDAVVTGDEVKNGKPAPPGDGTCRVGCILSNIFSSVSQGEGDLVLRSIGDCSWGAHAPPARTKGVGSGSYPSPIHFESGRFKHAKAS